jgi:hypothetical protein
VGTVTTRNALVSPATFAESKARVKNFDAKIDATALMVRQK